MIKLQVTDLKGKGGTVSAQVWPAHKDSLRWKAVHISDGRSFIMSEQAWTLLRQGATLNVKIGEQQFNIVRAP